jgi:glycosyltransferase involved in cell wall biosynthesis
LRIGFLISGSLDTLTGGYIYDRQVVDYLREKGHHIELIPLPERSYYDRLLHSPVLLMTCKLRHLSLDIIIEDELDHAALIFLNRRLKRQSGIPIVSIVHNLHSCELRPRWQNQLYRWIEKYYLTILDGFVFNSRTTCQAVENLVGRQKPRVIANPCGNRLPTQITESEIKERAIQPGPLRILFLGNLFRNKGLHILLTALAKLSDNDYYLTVIGDLTMDKSYVQTIRNQIRDQGLNNKVFIAGPLNNNDLAMKLKNHHVLVVPSFYEGFGMAYLEGMGAGLPAIGTTAGAASEIITHGQNGFLVPAGDSSGLFQHLRKLHEDRELLMSMSLNAFEHFKRFPTWQATGEIIHGFLQSFCPSPSL